MVWTAPMTAVDGSIFTADQYNTNVRDNLLETAVAQATQTKEYFAGSNANAIATRRVDSEWVEAEESTSSSSYTDLATVGPDATVSTSTHCLVMATSGMSHDTDSRAPQIAIAVSGATSIAATDATKILQIDGVSPDNNNHMGNTLLFDTLTPGVNTFTMKYNTASGTATFKDRHIIAMPL